MAKKKVVKKVTKKSKAKAKKSLTNSSKKANGSVSTKSKKVKHLDEQLDDIDTLIGEDFILEAPDDSEYEFFGDDDTVYPAE